MFLMQNIDYYFPMPNRDLTHCKDWIEMVNITLSTPAHLLWTREKEMVGMVLKLVHPDVVISLNLEEVNADERAEEEVERVINHFERTRPL